MNFFSLNKLEFPKIREILNNNCRTTLGRDYADNLLPSADPEEILKWQKETTEAVDALRLQPTLSFEDITDLTPYIRRASIGGVLDALELLACKYTLTAAGRLKRGLLDIKRELPELQKRAQLLSECHSLQEKISLCLHENGEIADSASLELGRLRQQMKRLESNLRKKLDEFLSKPEWLKFFQEPFYTLRGGRYVIPIKQEYRHQFPGLIQDQSASGATVFMEPLSLVGTTNELAAVRSKVHEEEKRILEQLSRMVSTYEEEIRFNLQLLGELDFILGKARLSLKMKAQAAEFSADFFLSLKKARHPLLKGKVVPLSLHLGKDFDCLIITGPNTGGKTVALKTVGLLVLMAQSGLHVPVGNESIFPFFKNVLVDIGDEQSIEQSLSTFSGHLKNIASFVHHADQNSLLLLDELGAGTDPEEGAALSMALLDYLLQKRSLILATTHYSELKVYAHNRNRVENACVEFDAQTLRPTYRLFIGIPGQSNAFEIASRYGLPTHILDKARNFLKPEQRELADLIRHLKEDQEATSTARTEAKRLQEEIEQIRDRARLEEAKSKEKERSVLEKATLEAQEIIRTARQEAEIIIRRLHEEQKGKEIKERFKTAEEARRQLHNLAGKIEEKSPALVSYYPDEGCREIKAGDFVEVPRLHQKGRILGEPAANGEVLVQIGSFKINLPLHELRPSFESKDEVSSIKTSRLENRSSIKTELDFRGLMVIEALEKIDKYLDSAYLAGLERVLLIHGKGTGALRSAVREYLKQHPFVQSFRSGSCQEGGSGVTVVEFK